MAQLKLSQSWVDRMTSEPSEEANVIGRGAYVALPEEALEELLERVVKSDAVSEMIRRKWFSPGAVQGVRVRTNALKDFLLEPVAGRPSFAAAAHFRRQGSPRSLGEEIVTYAWLCRISAKASQQPVTRFDATTFEPGALAPLVRLSTSPHGPREAIEYVKSLGVTVIIENSLPGMRTDGASLMRAPGAPVIGLTLRHDRLDSFWFTLLHEIGHIALHLSEDPRSVFVDILDEDSPEAEVEAEADAFAKDALVPRDVWLRSDAFRLGTELAVLQLAKKCHVHPAIVAGRLRFERRQFHAFSNLIGLGEVRNQLLTGG